MRSVVGLGRTMKTVFENANNFWALSDEIESLKVQLKYEQDNAAFRAAHGFNMDGSL